MGSAFNLHVHTKSFAVSPADVIGSLLKDTLKPTTSAAVAPDAALAGYVEVKIMVVIRTGSVAQLNSQLKVCAVPVGVNGTQSTPT